MGDRPKPLFNVDGIDAFRASDYHKFPEDEIHLVPVLFEGDAEGAIPKGARVEKVNSEDGDSFPDGAKGTVISSLFFEDGFVYYVNWDEVDGLPCLIMGHRIKESP